ncbi:MAG TPA: glycosyltransferase family 2 protein [Thermoanaerobacter sp.]|nr:MAG: family 2 glycosyl transferase [Thermoanaerobacter thermocopriae]HAA64159.1 glycosyltransferase family 2 protein [Thermoanaerobacter sp.]
MIEPKIGIVIVNYNGEKYINDCVRSISESTYKNYMVIVVDNASTDNSIKNLEEEFKERITIIKNNENLGFSSANNIGIKYALQNGCEFVILLNNDTVIDKDLIHNMVSTSLSNDNAIISPKIYYYNEPNKIWSAGGGINWKKGLSFHYGFNQIDKGQFDEQKEIDFATGCCILIHKSVFEKVGYLAEEYFLYFEDTDFCVRAKQKGIKIIYEPKAKLWHKVSSTTGGEESLITLYYGNRNRLYFNEKFNKENKFCYLTYFYITRMIKLLIWLIKGQKDKIKVVLEAIKDYKSDKVGLKNFDDLLM